MKKIASGLLTVGKALLVFLAAFLQALGPSTSSFKDEPYSAFNKYDYERQFKEK